MAHGSAGEAGMGSEAGRKAVRVSLTFQDFRSFITQYDSHISMGGMFIGTRSPLSPGTSCKLDVKLKDGYKLIQGLGEVAWTRDRAEGPDRPPGMGVRFRELEESSRDLIFEIVDRRLVDGSGVFQLDRAGEPLAQDIPDLEEILRRAERRREEAREAESGQTDSMAEEPRPREPEPREPALPEPTPSESWPIGSLAEEAVAAESEDHEDDDSEAENFDDSGSGEIVPGELAPELATGVLFGEGLDWLKKGFSDDEAGGEEADQDTGPQTSEQALQNLDDLLRETAPPEAPTTGEVEAITAADDLLSDRLSSPDLSQILGAPESIRQAAPAAPEPSPAPRPPERQPPAAPRPERPPVAASDAPPRMADPFSSGLSDLLTASESRPALPSEVLAAGGPSLPDVPLDEDQTVTLGSLEETSRLPIEDLVGSPASEISAAAGPKPPAEPAPGADSTVAPESSYYYGDQKSSRRPFLFILLGLLAAAAAAFFFLRGGLDGGSGEVARDPVATESGAAPSDRGEPSSAASPQVVQVPVQDSVPEPGAGVGAGQEALDPQGAAQEGTGPLGTGPGEDRLAGIGEAPVDQEAVSPAVSLDPMRSVVSITAREVPEGTLITVAADGAVEPGRYRYALIGSGSPRLLVRMLGVEKGSHPDTIAVKTGQVQQIRTGYHAGTAGQDLHIVLDLVSKAIVVDRVETQGNELLIWAESTSR